MEKLKVPRPVPFEFEISSPFGMRTDPLTGKIKHHNGIDFACPVGTSVHAMADCKVFKAGWEQSPSNYPHTYHELGFGLRVWTAARIKNVIYWIWYGHLNQILVADGADLKAGRVVGLSGNSGKSSGPHLHIQARQKDTGIFYNFEFIKKETT